MLNEESQPFLVSGRSSSLSSSNSECSELNECFKDDIILRKRLRSVSLSTINSAPIKPNTSRCVSNLNVNRVTKKPRKKYDHVQSKVKQYILNIKKECREQKRKQEQAATLKVDANQNEIDHQDNEELLVLKEKYTDICTNYTKALHEIDTLKTQLLDKTKSPINQFTPKVNSHHVRKFHPAINLITSTPGISLRGFDSTCNTEDVMDISVGRADPFLATNSCQGSNSSYSSKVPLNKSKRSGLWVRLRSYFTNINDKMFTLPIRLKNRNSVHPMNKNTAPELLVSYATSTQEDDHIHLKWNEHKVEQFKRMEEFINELVQFVVKFSEQESEM